MVLFSDDSDFRCLVEAMQRRGVRVTMVSTIATHSPMISDELRRQADAFIDLKKLQCKIGRVAVLSAVLFEDDCTRIWRLVSIRWRVSLIAALISYHLQLDLPNQPAVPLH